MHGAADDDPLSHVAKLFHCREELAHEEDVHLVGPEVELTRSLMKARLFTATDVFGQHFLPVNTGSDYTRNTQQCIKSPAQISLKNYYVQL